MKSLGMPACICALLLCASRLLGQLFTVISLTNTAWNYYQQGQQPPNSPAGVTWKDPQFNDAAWPTGYGAFGVEDRALIAPIRTSLILSNSGAAQQTITYYFRTHFNWPHGTNAILWFTNLIDDGVVVYLNGTEIYRYRVTVNPPTYSVVASSGVEAIYEVTNIFRKDMKAGDNVLAAEVHQTLSSSDIVFGLAVAAIVPEPPVITKQPEAEINPIRGKAFTLSVEATGTDLRYLWYSNGISIRHTNATLIATSFVETATFYATVSNMVGFVRSSDSVVRTIPDTSGPRILYAVMPVVDTNRVYVYFDEDILRYDFRHPEWSGSNTANYIVTDIATGERLELTSALIGIGLGAVRLTFSQNLDRQKSYEICINNISDRWTNQIALNSCVPLGIELSTNYFPFGSYWWFYDWVEAPPANWKDPGFIEDPQLWGQAPGMFYYNPAGSSNPPCTFRSWALSLGSGTFYFRKHFTASAGMLNGTLTAILGSVVDDGAVFYLNGLEIMRTNMPAGPITHSSRASAAGYPNACATNRLSVSNLLTQNNVLAVELHEFASFDFDLAFDASLSLNYVVTPLLTNREPAGEVFLRYSNHSPTELRLYWTNGMGYALEYANEPGGWWQELQPPSTNVIVDKHSGARFYRLNKHH